MGKAGFRIQTTTGHNKAHFLSQPQRQAMDPKTSQSQPRELWKLRPKREGCLEGGELWGLPKARALLACPIAPLAVKLMGEAVLQGSGEQKVQPCEEIA